MYRLSRWIVAVVAVAVTGLPLAACGQLPSTTAKQHDPVTVEPVGNTGVKRLTIEDRAVERLGVTTAPVVEERTPPARPGEPDGVRLLMPYAALLYLPDGTTFAYTNPDGTKANLPASLTVPVHPVAVTFRVLAPPGTPADATLYVPGSIPELGPWDPGKLAMTNKGNGIWEATVTVLDGSNIQYKYTRGTWEQVEDWGTIVGLTSRAVTVDGGITHTMLVDDTATNWGSPDVPDDHKAIQFWRDPLVVSTAFADGALTVQFQRDIQPTGADYTRSVAVHGSSGDVPGTVAEVTPGTLVWTPSSPLPAGPYTATVSGVNSTGPGGVPIRTPYTFAFTAP